MTEVLRPLTVSGGRLTLAGDSDDPYFRNISEDVPEQAPLCNYLRTHLASDAICLDVGANIGVTTLIMASLCPKGHVYAFEPGHENARWLRQNVKVNGLTNCTVIETAVGSTTGTISFNENRAWGTVANEPSASSKNVSITTLDAFIRNTPELQQLDFIKIDVEGFESHVIAGGSETLSRFRPSVWMEFNSWTLLLVANTSPFWFMTALLNAFDIWARMPDGTIAPVTSRDEFLHDNLVRHGCVDDLLMRLKRGASPPSLADMTRSSPLLYAADTTRLRAEITQLRVDIDAMRASTSWRVTAPLRAIKRAFS
jgi:FkbM family methyltransferase